MTDVLLPELIELFSRPRPNGSQAERKTVQKIEEWLTARDIAFREESFSLFPYFYELIGLWLILTRLLLALAVWMRLGWVGACIAAIGLLGGTLDAAFHFPSVTWFGKRRGTNIFIEFGPEKPKQEIILSAHYDSKTELLDHRKRMFFLKKLPFGMGLSLAFILLSPLDRFLLDQGSPLSGWTYLLSILLSLVLLFLSGGFGLNLLLGRALPQSQGIIDNGAACIILLSLAEKLSHEKIIHTDTRITLALFGGEEVDRQGSHAYVNDREWTLPVSVVNMEVMAQNGEYVCWQSDGTVFYLQPTSQTVTQTLVEAIQSVTGHPPAAGGPVLSDGASFIQAGLPTAVLGTYDSQLGDTGFHTPADNLSRLIPDRIHQGVEILNCFIEKSIQPDSKTKP